MMKNILNYFFRGLLFVLPIFATFYIILVIANWLDGTLNNMLFSWLPFDIPGLGIVTALLGIMMIGMAVSGAISKPIFAYFERLMGKTPLIKIIYHAFKDFTEAFVGEKKKFNRPVLVKMTEDLDRIGFLTETDLRILGVSNRVAVYCPHSYNFSGNLFLVSPDRITVLDIPASEAMKFAVSAGVTQIDNLIT